MLQFQCTSCQRTLRVKPEAAGKQVRCPCGTQLTVPAAVSGTSKEKASTSSSSAAASSSAQATVVVTCECGKKLRVPASAAGKAIRCPCGQAVAVPAAAANVVPAQVVATARAVPATPAPQSNDWLSALPLPPSPNYASTGFLNSGSSAAADPWAAAPSGAATSNAASPYAPPSNSSMASTYLQQAEDDARQRRANERGMAKGSLSAAMWTMFIVGALTVIVNIIMLANSQAEVNAVMAQNGEALDGASLLLFVRVFYGIFLLSGIAMIILGALIYQFPLASPLIALVIYIGGIIVVGILDPFSLLKGIIIKIAVVGALVKAVNDGAYYKG